MALDNNHEAFFALVRAGLWEKEIQLLPYEQINYNEINRLAEEQSVTGLIAAGFEHIVDVKAPQDEFLQFVGSALQIERQNLAMNEFIAKLIEKLREADVYTILMKGQGIAQCYERPLWRASGDVDLFMSDENYKKAVIFLSPLSTSIDKENTYNKHLAMSIGSWVVELHGALRFGLWGSMDAVLDEVQKEVLCGGTVRSWMNGATQTFLIRADEDVIFVFAHILQHFYQEGVGLRQICDWCRLLWTFRGTIDKRLLESRLHKMRVIREWKSFAAFAVEYLGMPNDSMPFYSSSNIWRRKAEYIKNFVLKVGNYGVREPKSSRTHSAFIRKILSFFEIFKYTFRHFFFFPISSIRSFFYQVWIGMKLNIVSHTCRHE